MQSLRRCVPAVLLFSVSVLAGCDSPLGPADVRGTYVLETVGGAPLPAIVTDGEYHRTTILAATLRLDADDAGTLTTDVHYRAYAPSQEKTETTQSDLRYRLRGSRIEVTFLCPPLVVCNMTPGPHLVGRVDGDRLVVSALAGEQVYRRGG